MRATFVTDRPPIFEDWFRQRRSLGPDLFDAVWEGEYRVAPAPSLIVDPDARAVEWLDRGPHTFRRPQLPQGEAGGALSSISRSCGSI